MDGWTLLLITPLFAVRPPVFGGVVLQASLLLIPFAAMLGRRFGFSGVVSVALGGILLVPWISFSSGFAIGGNPSIYLIALAAAFIAAARVPFVECFQWPKERAAVWWLSLAAPFLLVLSAGARGSSGSEVSVGIAFNFSALGFALLFLLGGRGIRWAAFALGLALAGSIGWGLALLEVSRSHPATYITLLPMQPPMVIAALLFVSAGEAVRSFLSHNAPNRAWRRPYVTMMILLLLAMQARWAVIAVESTSIRGISLLGVTAALPLAALMAGLLKGVRGVVVVTSIAVLTAVVQALSWEAPFSFGLTDVGAPFIAAAYGLMGTKLAEAVRSPADFAPLRRRANYVLAGLVVVAITASVWEDHGAVGAVLFLAVAVAAVFAFLRARRWLAAQGLDVNSKKWLPFAAAAALIGAIATNLKGAYAQLKFLMILGLVPLSLVSSEARDAARKAFEGGDSVSLILLLATAYLVVTIAVVRTLLVTTPKIWGDLKKIYAFVKRLRRHWRAMLFTKKAASEHGGVKANASSAAASPIAKEPE